MATTGDSCFWLADFLNSSPKIFRNWPIRNKNCLWQPCLKMDRDEMSNLYRGPSIDDSYQVSVHLPKRFQRRFLRNRPIRNKNSLWQVGWFLKKSSCLQILGQMNRNLVGSTYGRFCIKFSQSRMKGERHRLSPQPLVLERRRFLRNRPIRNKNSLWQPWLY
jgi:hypothetical protein